MKSIKTKLLVAILLIVSIFVAGIFTYSLTFKKYYQNQKFNEMKDVLNEVEDLSVDFDNIDDLLKKYNIQIDIEDAKTSKIVYANHKSGNGNSGIGGKNRFETIKSTETKNKIINSFVHDKSTGADLITSKKITDDGQYIITAITPISEIDEAVEKSVQLLSIILIPISIVVVIVTIIFSGKFTKPIIEITNKTSEIENLNFTTSLNIDSKDEIGVLANGVNSLSNTIKNTLDDLKKKNLSLEEMIENERKNEIVRKEFVSSVSHELKSPIAVISGYIQALQDGIITNEEDKVYYLSVINEEANRMHVIVNDLLDLYKLESNTFKLNFSEIELGDLIRKIIKKNSLKLEENKINLETDIEEVIILGDEIRIEQAVQNYLNNAISHVDNNKKIKITVNKNAEIRVYNSGDKIEDKNLEKIWQGFVRVDKVRNYKEKRVGLGLAIVKQIVNLHSGECGVENEKNGVVFNIKLKC